jgi:hypothetical protein
MLLPEISAGKAHRAAQYSCYEQAVQHRRRAFRAQPLGDRAIPPPVPDKNKTVFQGSVPDSNRHMLIPVICSLCLGIEC